MSNTREEPGARLLRWLQGSLSRSEMQLIGAVIVSWAFFEHQLERAIWQLSKENPQGMRPTTDSLQAVERIRRFRSISCSVGKDEWKEVATLFCDAAENVLAIRNALAHGHVLPHEVGGGMINNPRWHGERRKRDPHSVHVTDRTLGLVLDAMYELLAAVHQIPDAAEDSPGNPRLLEWRQKLHRSKTTAGEIRHLSELVNREKY